MAVFLLSLTFSMNAQEVGAKRYAEEYSRYVARMERASKEVLDYEPWCDKNNYTPYRTIPKSKLLPPSSPGTYLLKGSNQILTGVGLQMASGIMVIVAMKNSTIETNNGYIDTQPILYVAGATALTGLVLQIVGIRNIGKAGILLNENGVGIHIPIK